MTERKPTDNWWEEEGSGDLELGLQVANSEEDPNLDSEDGLVAKQRAMVPDAVGRTINSNEERHEYQSLIPGSYFVFGADKRARDLQRHTCRSEDLYRWIYKLMQSEEDILFVVADNPLNKNIFIDLKNKEMNHRAVKDRRSDEELMEEANEKARLIGIKDLLFIEAVQDYIFSADGEGSRVVKLSKFSEDVEAILKILKKMDPNPERHKSFKKKSVVLMSDLFSRNGGVEGLNEQLKNLLFVDLDLVKKMFDCVPQSMINERFGKGREDVWKDIQAAFMDDKKDQFTEYFDLFSYAMTEVSIILLSGKKYGHEGERQYDEIADYVYPKYGTELNLPKGSKHSFVYPKVEMEGDVPYRPVPAVSTPRVGVLSFTNMFKESDALEAMDFMEGQLMPIYRRYFNLIEQTNLLTQFERGAMFDVEARKILKEAILSLSRSPAAKLALKMVGVTEKQGFLPEYIESLARVAAALSNSDGLISDNFSADAVIDFAQFLHKKITGEYANVSRKSNELIEGASFQEMCRSITGLIPHWLREENVGMYLDFLNLIKGTVLADFMPQYYRYFEKVGRREFENYEEREAYIKAFKFEMGGKTLSPKFVEKVRVALSQPGVFSSLREYFETTFKRLGV